MLYADLMYTLEEKNQKILRVHSHNCAGLLLNARNGILYTADIEVNGNASKGYNISCVTFNRLAREGYPVHIGWGYGEGKFPNAAHFYGTTEETQVRRYLGSYVYKHWKAGTLKTWPKESSN